MAAWDAEDWGSIKMRQAERSSELTEPIKASLELLEAVFATQPECFRYCQCRVRGL